MKDMNGIKIIAVDHGYSNIKTANHCFPTGILHCDSEPLFGVATMIRELRRIGYNIDQALRAGVNDPEDKEMLRQTFEEVRQTLRQIFVAYTGQEPSEG